MDIHSKPFPLAVFGTLREIPSDQGNARLMRIRKPLAHRKCFIPHFLPTGIWLEFKPYACGVAELFFYDPSDWGEVLSKVDSLEGLGSGGSKYGYHRTLINVRLLPDDYACDVYNKGLSLKARDLSIPREEWLFPPVAAWVYSSTAANNECKRFLGPEENPIICD